MGHVCPSECLGCGVLTEGHWMTSGRSRLVILNLCIMLSPRGYSGKGAGHPTLRPDPPLPRTEATQH